MSHSSIKRDPTTGRYPWMSESGEPVEETGAAEGCYCTVCTVRRMGSEN